MTLCDHNLGIPRNGRMRVGFFALVAHIRSKGKGVLLESLDGFALVAIVNKRTPDRVATFLQSNCHHILRGIL